MRQRLLKQSARAHLVVRQNPKRIAELFRRSLVLCYIHLHQMSTPQSHDDVCACTHQEVDKRFKRDRAISLQELVVDNVQIFILRDDETRYSFLLFLG